MNNSMEVKHLKTCTKELSLISSSEKELYIQFPLFRDLNYSKKPSSLAVLADLVSKEKFAKNCLQEALL